MIWPLSSSRFGRAFAIGSAACVALAAAPETVLSQGAGPAPNTKTVLVGIRSETAYEQNPTFAIGGPEDISTQLSGTGSLVMAVGRGTLTAGGQVDRSFYKRLTTLNRFTYSGNGAGQYNFSSRFGVQAAVSYATMTIAGQSIDDIAAPVPVLDPATIAPPVAPVNSVPVPSTVFHSLSAAGGASYTLSERTSAQFSGTYSKVMFDTTGIPEGSTIGGGAALQHRYSERGSVGLSYQYQTNQGVSQAPTVHTALGTWARSYERIDLGAQLGVVSNATQGVDSWTEPGGGAQLKYRMARGSIDFRYNRSAAQAFGLGRILISDEGTVAIGRTFGKYAMNAFGTLSHGHDTELKSYKLDMYSAGLGVERPIMTTIRLVGSLYYRSRSEVLSVDDRGVRMLVTYNSHYF